MIERLRDEQAEIQRVFLWQDIVAVLRANADCVGIQASCLDITQRRVKPTRIVLAEALDTVDDSIELWGEVTGSGLIGKANLFYKSPSGKEMFSYEVTPDGIAQYSPNPTALDDYDIFEMRDDLKIAPWDKDYSVYVAENFIYFA